MTHRSTAERYAPLLPDGVLTEADAELASKSLARFGSLRDLAEWTESRTMTYELGDRPYRMLVDRPKASDSRIAVVIGGEFGNGLTPAVSARARVIRDIVAPEATLVVQPNSTLLETDNMNYSREERLQLRRGILAPVISRIALSLHRDARDAEDLTLVGLSQGATVMLGYGASPYGPDGAAVAAVEAPNVVARPSLKIAADFLGSAGQLKDVIAENFDDGKDPLLGELLDGFTIASNVRFGSGLLLRRNRILRGILRTDTAIDDMRQVLNKHGSVVHVWGTIDEVSPRDANRDIHEELKTVEKRLRYEGIELDGSDHSVTNNYLVCGVLARHARNLTTLVD